MARPMAASNPNGNADDAARRRAEDIALLVALRCGDERAYQAFARRFAQLLLDQARRLGVDRADRESVVTEFLDDLLIKLTTMQAPASLPTFVVTAFRNHVSDARRSAEMRERHDAAVCEVVGEVHVVRGVCSEYMLHASRPADEDVHDPSAGARALVQTVLQRCTADERRLLVWRAHRVPLREIATWLDISHDAAKQRVSRLRARLIRECVMQLDTLSPADRDAVAVLLRRAGINIPDTSGGAAA